VRKFVLHSLMALGAACLPIGVTPAGAEAAPAGGKTRILCSVFPIVLFTRNVAAGSDAFQIDLMLPAAMGCPHDYLLTPQDMRKIAEADVFIANGLGLEEFLGDPLRKANPKIVVVDSSRGIEKLIPLTAKGTESARDLHAGFNPHLFASPRMAASIVRNIASELSKLDPPGAELYEKNSDAYAAKLDRLAGEFAAAVHRSRSRRIVTQHAVFDYLARDAGLEIVAVVEEAPGQEPSAARMLDLVNQIKASKAAAVFTEPQYPSKVGETIAREAGIPVATLDPVASGPENIPLDYYEKVMKDNIATLERVLGAEAK